MRGRIPLAALYHHLDGPSVQMVCQRNDTVQGHGAVFVCGHRGVHAVPFPGDGIVRIEEGLGLVGLARPLHVQVIRRRNLFAHCDIELSKGKPLPLCPSSKSFVLLPEVLLMPELV